MEDAYNEGRDNEPEYENCIHNIRSTNDLNVYLLEYHAPDLCNTYNFFLILMMFNNTQYYDECNYDGGRRSLYWCRRLREAVGGRRWLAPPDPAWAPAGPTRRG